MSFIAYLGMAFVGGLILNIMPCVLPVLTMKVFHLIEQADMGRSAHHRHGLAYGAGVVSTFAVLGAALLVLRAGGSMVGWGMQFSNPAFVAAMTAVVFVFGLNALGVFEFNVSVTTGESRPDYWGSAINGVVASIMATPCSAPILGTAAGFALSTAAAWQTMMIFVMIGVGLAFPFVLFSFIPALGKMLPRPGAWMETFKHLMGFTLVGAALWLFTVLMKQISADGVVGFLIFLFVLSIGAWAIGRFAGVVATRARRWAVRLAVLTIVGMSGYLFIDFAPPEMVTNGQPMGEASVIDGEIAWRQFDSDLVMETLATGRPVFMDYTADWCVNCKANERLFINVPQIRALFDETQILPMKADLTVENEEIRQWLRPFPYSGIPVYVIYLPDQTYDLLPQAITTELLADRLTLASERYPRSTYTSD